MASCSMRERAAASAANVAATGSAGSSPRSLRSRPAGTTSAPPSTTGVPLTTWRIDWSSFLRLSRRPSRSATVRRTFSRLRRTSLPASLSSLSFIQRSDQKSISLVSRSWTAASVLSTWAMRRCGDFAEVLGDERCGGEGEGALLPGRRESRARRARPSSSGRSAVGKRFEVEVRCPAGKGGRAVGADADELQPLGEHGAVAGLDLVGEQEEQRRLDRPRRPGRRGPRPGAAGCACCSSSMSLTASISGWPGCISTARGEARLVERLNGILGEADALVALQDGLVLAAIAPGDPAVALADGGGDVGDLEAARPRADAWCRRARRRPS